MLLHPLRLAHPSLSSPQPDRRDDLLAGIDLETTRRWFTEGASFLPPDLERPGLRFRIDEEEAHPRHWNMAVVQLDHPPARRELVLQLHATAAGPGSGFMTSFKATSASGETVASSYFPTCCLDGKGVDVEHTLSLPREASKLEIAFARYKGPAITCSGIRIRRGEKAMPRLHRLSRPGVLYATANTCVYPCAGEAGVVSFPVPLCSRGQVPLAFLPSAEPASALESFRLRRRADGCNLLAELRVRPPAGGARVRWEALVLVGDEEPTKLGFAPRAAAPPPTQSWLRSTACVQSAHPEIAARAAELGEAYPEIVEYVSKVIEVTSRLGGESPLEALDAYTAFRVGGSCTSRANLAAALLRARGIPARTVAHLPVSPRSELYQHWLVEWWHPAAGWVRSESSTGELQVADRDLVVLNVSQPDDEDRAFDPQIPHSHVLPGLPLHASHLLSPELSWEPAEGSGLAWETNSAHAVLEIPWRRARQRELRLHALRHCRSLFQLARAGHAAHPKTPWLQQALMRSDPDLLLDSLAA